MLGAQLTPQRTGLELQRRDCRLDFCERDRADRMRRVERARDGSDRKSSVSGDVLDGGCHFARSSENVFMLRIIISQNDSTVTIFCGAA